MSQNQEKINTLASKIWSLSKDKILVYLRFLDVAISNIRVKIQTENQDTFFDNNIIYYNPLQLIELYKQNLNNITRLQLHILFHLIFSHTYNYQKLDTQLWDIAADMAVENAVLSLQLSDAGILNDDKKLCILEDIKRATGIITAERIYKHLKNKKYNETELLELSELFEMDNHFRWKNEDAESMEMTLAQWNKISERIKANLKAFSDGKASNESILQNLNEATKEKYDYDAFLRRFCVSGEDMQINDDEFDYVYYTHGLSLYGNMPLVEPLEYKDINKIKEFVIAIDTSASCQGEVVQEFLNKTYNILKSSENFFRKVNIHILQCDCEVRSDTKITNDEEFETFMKKGKLEGFGATDFRPVFTYVDRAIENHEFENLRGLIYFTDGYGIFPENKPLYNYETAFVFIDEYENMPQVPNWAVKVVLPAE